MPQHTARGEAAQQHRSLTNHKKGKTTQPGWQYHPNLPLIEEARRHEP
jgi:hypothetical protein